MFLPSTEGISSGATSPRCAPVWLASAKLIEFWSQAPSRKGRPHGRLFISGQASIMSYATKDCMGDGMKVQTLAAGLLALCLCADAVRAQETPHLQFVTEYIRELGKMERLRSQANDELNDGSNKMAGCVRSTTRFQLELQSQIFMLRNIRLNPPFDELAPSLATFNEQKLGLYKKMGYGCTALMGGPKPGVDYDVIAADAPKITAQLEYIDNAMLESSPMIFATLIDPVPDANNKMSRLIITSAERKKLIADIDSFFGAELNQKDQGYVVSAASVLKAYLGKEKGYSVSDEARRPKQ
jgi:hypothetical protein